MRAFVVIAGSTGTSIIFKAFLLKEEKQRRKSYSKVEILYVNKLTRNHLTDIYQET